MLILTRRVGETLMIGDQVSVTVLGVKGNQVRIGMKKRIMSSLVITTSIVNAQNASRMIKATILSRFNCFIDPKLS